MTKAPAKLEGRRRVPPLTLRVITTLVLGLVVAGCSGGADSEAAGEWASSMCRGLERFSTDMQKVTTDLETLRLRTDVSVKERKGLFIEAIDEGAGTTGELIETLETTPVPDVEGGREAVDAFIHQMEEMKTIFEEFNTRFRQIDTSAGAKAKEEAEAAAIAMQDEFIHLQEDSQGLTGISPEIDEAINESPDCQGVLATPGP